MKIRELLRYEIWSKRTTRKILAVFGIVVAVLALGFLGWYEAELRWLTKGERAAAKVALQQIDALQNADSLSDEEFEIRRKQTDLAVDATEKAARTIKDERTYLKLTMCFMGAESARIKVVKQRLIQQGKLHETADEWEWFEQGDLRRDTVAHQYCLELHKELE
ncbi:MAG: hypothetical protein ACLQG3_06865 [Terracidiphilus sp.]